MTRTRGRRLLQGALLLLAALLLAGAPAAAQDEREETFEEKLGRIDRALRKNPKGVVPHALRSCARQRDHAIRLHNIQQYTRAHRSLDYCAQLLHISKKRPPKVVKTGPSIAELEAKAAQEMRAALELEPDIDNGLEIYRECARCHTPEGSGLANVVPQIAGQHRTVVIKQLADIRAGTRDVVFMAPYATVKAIGGVQAVADVAGYIDTLEISTDVHKGPGDDLELGEKLYRENCVSCHGENGEGNAEAFVPRIHAQHYEYLVWQFERIQNGKRHNADPGMRAQIEGFSERQIHAVADYVSRLEPAPELQAPPGWKNPDFAELSD